MQQITRPDDELLKLATELCIKAIAEHNIEIRHCDTTATSSLVLIIGLLSAISTAVFSKYGLGWEAAKVLSAAWSMLGVLSAFLALMILLRRGGAIFCLKENIRRVVELNPGLESLLGNAIQSNIFFADARLPKFFNLPSGLYFFCAILSLPYIIVLTLLINF